MIEIKIYRIATVSDIPQMQIVRNAVKENMLSNPNLVTDADCEEFIVNRGRGWICEIDNRIVGFAIADLKENNIWALFVDPAFEKLGIGSKLHDMMIDWYFEQTNETVWLGTDPATRAFTFYREKGWEPKGNHGDKEAKFIMSKEQWQQRKSIS